MRCSAPFTRSGLVATARTCGLLLLAVSLLVGPALLLADDAATNAVAKADAGSNVAEAKAKQMEELDREREEINVKYAETFLRLSEVQLQKILDFNRRVPGGFSEAEVERLRRMVEVAKERLEWVRKAGHKQSAANIFQAEATVQNAETNYNKAQSANNRVPGAVPQLEMDRLRLVAELARMSLQKARLAAEANSSVADVQWELDQLREDVLQLRSRVEAITSRR